MLQNWGRDVIQTLHNFQVKSVKEFQEPVTNKVWKKCLWSCSDVTLFFLSSYTISNIQNHAMMLSYVVQNEEGMKPNATQLPIIIQNSP
jgi:hypothetical protein